MTQLGPEKVALFLRQQAAELTRIWRMARANARTDVFPGLLDDLVEPFFVAAANALEAGEPAEVVWDRLAGVLRWPSGPSTTAELAEEWALVSEVLAAACEAVNAEHAVEAWLVRAAGRSAQATAALDRGGEIPRGIVPAVVFSSLAPRHPPAEREETPG